MKISEALDLFAKEVGIYTPEKAKDAHIYAQSIQGASAGDIELNEAEVAKAREIFRDILASPQKMEAAVNEHARVVNGN